VILYFILYFNSYGIEYICLKKIQTVLLLVVIDVGCLPPFMGPPLNYFT